MSYFHRFFGPVFFLSFFLFMVFSNAEKTIAAQKNTWDKDRKNQNEKQEVTLDKVQSALPEIAEIATQLMDQTGVPGLAVAVVYKDKVVYLRGFGIREAGKIMPVDGDTVFQLASVSKPIASTVIAALAGKGLVSWDDRIIDLDPGFRLSDSWVTSQVTLRDIFSHRSGLPDHAGDLLEDLGYDRKEVIFRLRHLNANLAEHFRSEYAYTNFGLTAAAVAAAGSAGMSWEDLSVQELYDKLGMASTNSRHADFMARKNRALGHVLVDGNWIHKYDRQPDAQSPAGGVRASARDMGQWLRLQIGNGSMDGKQIIAANALAETHQIISRHPADPYKDRAGFYGR